MTLSPSLTPTEKKIVLAAQEPRIKETEAFTIAQTVTNVVSGIYVRLGNKPKDDNERRMIQDCIIKDLAGSFPNLTLKEFEIACYKGSMGDFRRTPDEVLYLSPEKVHSWLKLYIEMVKREAIAKQREYEYKLDKEQGPSELEIKLIEEAYLKRMQAAFENFIKTGTYSHYEPGHLFYDWLDKRGMIKITDERKKEIFKTISDSYQERIKEYDKTKNFLAPKSKKELLIEWSKQFSIQCLFTEINEMGMTLLDYIELNRS
jgi:hypothetical protein